VTAYLFGVDLRRNHLTIISLLFRSNRDEGSASYGKCVRVVSSSCENESLRSGFRMGAELHDYERP